MPAVRADDLIQGLRRAGMRVTAPRRAICAVLADRHDDHLTVAELHERAEELMEGTIDLSTVYRTIDALQEAGEIHHVHLGHGPAVIHVSEHFEHHHLVCEVCGRAEDIPIEELEALTRHLAERYEFAADSVHFAMVGRCLEHRNDL